MRSVGIIGAIEAVAIGVAICVPVCIAIYMTIRRLAVRAWDQMSRKSRPIGMRTLGIRKTVHCEWPEV